MKFKIKTKKYNTEWHKKFAWRPIKTEDGYVVWLEKVERRYKVHMDGGKYVFRCYRG